MNHSYPSKKISALFLLAVLFSLTLFAQAPTEVWNKRYDNFSAAYDEPYVTAVGTSGNVYVAEPSVTIKDCCTQPYNVAEVYVSVPEGLSVGEIFPNPVVNGYSLTLRSGQALMVKTEIMDMLGRTVQKADYVLREGDNKIEMDVQDIPAGNYVVRVIEGNEVMVKKFVKTSQ